MTPHQPEGSPWPLDGHLPADLAEAHLGRPLSLYIHVPFCTVRCGYCDFNTYTTEFGDGADHATYADSVIREMDLAVRVMDEAGLGRRPVRTVFFGGGTPTLLPAEELARILAAIGERWPLGECAEITSEANPETVDEKYLQTLRKAGVTRVSVGMQSAVPSVLKTLDRTHRPERVSQVVQWAKNVGLDVSVDLIYGTPGETLGDWKASVHAAVDMKPHHISAYALVVEDGTKMGSQVTRGELPTPDPDDEAEKYECADQILSDAGYQWYEISNFARLSSEERAQIPVIPRHASMHNLAYWRDWDWWGFGPGAHSHIGKMRWWNLKHPTAYAGRVQLGQSPAIAGEILDADTRELERVLLGVRTYEGLPLSPEYPHAVIAELISDGLIDGHTALVQKRIRLTLRGRLLADYVTHRLVDA